tara:strand:+ start:186 stop:380 length:195 start_codon:yes stop_codon:yes gene_type:complete
MKVGQTLTIKHGGNQYGGGQAFFTINKITKHGNIYGVKYSTKNNKVFNKNHKLDMESVIWEKDK